MSLLSFRPRTQAPESAELDVLRAFVSELRRVSEAAMHGDTEARIDIVPGVADLPDAVALRRALNGTLDRTDAFAREVTGALVAIGEGRLHRKVLLDGLEGGYRRFAEDINVARKSMIESEARAQEDEQLRLTLALQFEESVMQVAEQVAAATVELSATADNLALNTDNAVELATSATSTAESLDEASHTIESVVAIISAVANQTKLLALNAQIEAARAGAAGRGFEVVASEVKSLAETTAQSTADISKVVRDMIEISGRSTDAMRSVEVTVRDMSPMVADVRAAVDGGTTGTSDLHGLAQMAEHLRTQVDSFLTVLRRS